MGKRKSKNNKRSTKRLPRGLPVRAGGGGAPAALGGGNWNPFEEATRRPAKRAKFEVANRGRPAASSLRRPQQQQEEAPSPRVAAVKALRQRGGRNEANRFVDRRIGEYDGRVSAQERTLARLVRERTRRSKRSRQFALDDDDGGGGASGGRKNNILTHGGKAIDQLNAADHVMLSDDEEDEMGGDLDALDTELHFGGGGGGKSSSGREASIYGAAALSMSTQYTQKKTDLDDLIMRRKILKAERQKSKEEQVDRFEAMDESFAELAAQLQFRDKEKDAREHLERQRAGTLSKEDQEFADWDLEMKRYMYVDTRKVRAVDRTKTPEEIAKEEAERLHALETRRLARMNGDFEDDDFSDVEDSDGDDDDSDGDSNRDRRRKRRQRRKHLRDQHPEALDSDSDDDSGDQDQLQTRFTADGLVQVDKDGIVVGRVGDEGRRRTDLSEKDSSQTSSKQTVYAVGDKVIASYRANEQYNGMESWFSGTVSGVKQDAAGNVVSYDIEYDDGDFEEKVEPRHVKSVEKTQEELEMEAAKEEHELALKRKQEKAKEKAR